MDPQNDSIVLEEEIDPNYEPTEREVLEYATWLGMDLENEQDLFWIAREGLKVRPCLSLTRCCCCMPTHRHCCSRVAQSAVLLLTYYLPCPGAASRELEAVQNDRHGGDLLL